MDTVSIWRIHIVQSIFRKGNCLDNTVAENFFGIVKPELLYAENLESAELFLWKLYGML